MMVEGAMQVALENWHLKKLQKQLQKEGKSMSKLAPPEGLYLARIIY